MAGTAGLTLGAALIPVKPRKFFFLAWFVPQTLDQPPTPLPQSQVLLGISLTFRGCHSWKETGWCRADVLGLRPTSGWECSALGTASRVSLTSCQRLRGVLNRNALKIQVWRWYLSKRTCSNTSDLRGLMNFGWVVINKKQVSSSVCCIWKAFLLCIEWLLEIDKICQEGPSLTASCLSS